MRVLLTNLPPLLRGILSEALAGESDITVVGGAPSADLGALVRELSPDVVLVQASKGAAADIARGLESVGLVAIDPDACHAYVYAWGDAPVVLADVSPTTIIMAIRSLGVRESSE